MAEAVAADEVDDQKHEQRAADLTATAI